MVTDKELNVEIAEYCRWRNIREQDYQPFGTNEYIDGPSQVWVGIHPESDVDSKEYEVIPDYCNDLTARAEAENVLTTTQTTTMSQYLHRRLGMLWGFATASQRAEAFVRTIGKWD